jgi:hypothetical protein
MKSLKEKPSLVIPGEAEIKEICGRFVTDKLETLKVRMDKTDKDVDERFTRCENDMVALDNRQ